ncbi:MAG: S8 family serine peptidase [Bacteroidota bacterium]
MKKQLFQLFILLLTVSVVSAQTAISQVDNVIRSDARATRGGVVPGVLLVKFKDGIPANPSSVNGLKKVGVTTVDALLEKYQAKTVAKLFPTAQPLIQKKLLKIHTGQTIEQPNLHNIYKIELVDPTKLVEAIEEFKQDATVEFAEPDFIYSIVADKPVSGVLSEKEARKLSKPASTNRLSTVTPNDPLYSQQWYIPAVQADAVWDSTEGDTSQVIAILDSGVDWHHPDLANNIWINTAEANGVAGVDDDGDGYIDDIRGWDFINNDNDPSDDNSHGTHVAGIACAEGNNGIGIAGVDWHARIMPVKVFQSNGQGDAATISQGINYAASKGATVINMSFGSYARSLTMEAALQNAYATCVLVAAAGNDEASINSLNPGPFYPAALSYVLGVQATTQSGGLASFSNSDPDGPVYSQYPYLFNYELQAPGDGILSTIPDGNYRVYSGTSMAAPVVAGAVALYRQLHPTESQELMWGNLINTCSGNIKLFDAISVHANPVLWFVSNTIVDTLAGDNNNGLVDAGETIQQWFTVRNTWGQSDSVFVGLRLGEFEDTSVAHILNPTVFIGSISPYGTRTNETNPFSIRVSPSVAEGRTIVFQALLWSHGSTDTTTQQIVLTASNGEQLAGVMDTTFTLTANRIWLVNQSFKVGSDGHLIIAPGTKIILNKIVVNNGHILANGTADSNVVINGPSGFRGTGNFTFSYTQFNATNDGFGDMSTFVAVSDYHFDHCKFLGISLLNYSNGGISPFLGNGFSFSNCVIQNCDFIVLNYCMAPTMVKCNMDNCITYATTSYASSGAWFPGNYNNFNRITNYYPPFCNTSVVFPTTDVTSVGNNFLGFGQSSFAVYANGTRDIVNIPNQYWGTVDSATIEKRIFDFWENPSLPMVNFKPFLTAPSDSAHGIVWKVLVDGIDPQDQKKLMNPIGGGAHRFDVYFNRPMDTTFTPQLSFGVRDPFNQQAVADSARWSSDHRMWTAYKTIKLYTGDGINTISVAGAKDPEGFDIPVENMRFQFLINAAGTSSVDFTATPGLGKIGLEWNNAGLVDLLGFNMYRFTNVTDTTYSDTTVINKKLITDTLYTDFDVIPGKKYYYSYKVVRTDFSESDFSHIASTKALTSSPGDANGDLAVDVLDVVTTVSYILGQNPQPFIFAAADINHDSTINVLDLVGVINIILHPSGNVATTLSKNTGGGARLDLNGNAINLTTSVPVSAIQFRLQGKGLKDIQFTPDPSIVQFETASNGLGDTVRVFVIYNLKGVTLAAGTYTLGRFSTLPLSAALAEGVIADAQGKSVVTSIYKNGQALIPEEYYLNQNFPNPFNMSTRIQFGVPSQTKVKIVLYNILGQKVKTFDLGERAPGRYDITWNGVNEWGKVVSSGIYFYRFESGKFTQTKKLVLIK